MRANWFIGILIVGLIAFSPLGKFLPEKSKTPATEQPVTATKLPAEVDTLNQASRKMYADARKRVLSTIPVVIIVSGDELILHKKGKRTAVTVIPAEYHTLKSIAHTTLALFSHLSDEPDRPLDEERLKTLKEYQTLITAVGPAVEKFGFDADTLARQKRILTRADQVIAKVLQDGKVAPDDLTKFCRGSRADVLANGMGAVRAQLTATHKQVMEWKKDMTGEEWATLTVMVPGVATARVENAAVQYFARLFGETSGEGRRVVYAESLYEEEKSLNLLGTLRLDSKLATAVFGDSFRMYRDFLADSARTVIDEILAPQ